MTGQVVFQTADGEPAVAELSHGESVDTPEEVWRRRFQATYEWVPLELGWVKQARLLVLYCLGPQPIEVACADPQHGKPLVFARVRPGGLPLIIEPPDAAQLRLRCPQGAASCRLFAVPAADKGD